MKKFLPILSLLVVILAACLYFLLKEDSSNSSQVEELEVHCAAGLRKPVQEIAEQYEAEYGVKIRLNYGGSGQLYGSLKLRGGDLYIPADSSYIENGVKEGLIAESIPLSYLTAGIVVPKGNPQGIKSLLDLTKQEVSVALAEKSAAVGKFTHKVLEDAGLLEGVESGNLSKFPTVNEVATQVKLSSVDAGIIWDALMSQYDGLEFIHVPEFDAKRKLSTVGVIKTTKHPAEAIRFARYLAAKDKGGALFKKHGFEVKEGDVWQEKPKVVLYSGSMLRPAIQDQLKAFEEREGCEITVKYDGCGVLVTAMDAGTTPDSFFSCDVDFMNMVQDRFEKSVVISSNDIVMIVEKGNKLGIKDLNSLTKSGIKLGIADQTKSALGKLTFKMLEQEGVLEGIQKSKNIVTMVAKGDDLVNQMQAGALDVALVYRSNAMASASIMKHCEIISVEAGQSYASQPFAISKESKHKQLLERLRDALVNETSEKSFKKYGFYWKLEGNKQ